MATKPALLAAAILLLAGCDFIADKAAENSTEQNVKDGFQADTLQCGRTI